MRLVLWIGILASLCQLATSWTSSFFFSPKPPPTSTSTTTRAVNNNPQANGLDADYPYSFTGRLVVLPRLVRTSTTTTELLLPDSVTLLSLFGYTLGGIVALDYDTSPVGPYREVVSLGGTIGGTTRNGGGGLAQWGEHLYVSTPAAQRVCKDVWNLPAQLADMDFVLQDDGEWHVEQKCGSNDDNKVSFWKVQGWPRKRTTDSQQERFGRFPILWTPTIKALWLPIMLFGYNRDVDDETALPLHRIRLSASSVRLQLPSSFPKGGPAFIVDNVLIEISNRIGSL